MEMCEFVPTHKSLCNRKLIFYQFAKAVVKDNNVLYNLPFLAQNNCFGPKDLKVSSRARGIKIVFPVVLFYYLVSQLFFYTSAFSLLK